MFNKLKINFPEWKKRTVKFMFPDVINPICFVEKKITIISYVVGFIFLEILLAIVLGEISVNMKLVMVAHAVAVLISTLFWAEPAKYDFNAQDIENLTVKRILIFNLARGVNFLWLLLPMAGYVVLMGFVLLFPISYGIYLYSIHIFFIALYFYIKKNNLQLIDAMKSFADGAFSIILYVCSGFNFPYISMCGSGKIMTKFGITRR
jgi:hypothetical protein